MATGMAIMGFGGGAFIASPLLGLADEQVRDLRRMSAWSKPSSSSAASTSVFMMVGSDDRARAGARVEAGRLRAARHGAPS